MKKKAFTLIELMVVIAVIAVIALIISSISLHSKTQKSISQQTSQQQEFGYSPYLPNSAINVKSVSTHWCYFDLDGRTFLFYKDGDSSSLVEISKISAEKQ